MDLHHSQFLSDTRQGGAGAAGFLFSAIPILLLGLGGVETAHWLLLRQTLGLALVQAGRAAIVHHAQPDILAQAFESALRMVYVQPQQRHEALAWRRQQLGGTAWQIRVLQPTRGSFSDHADPTLTAVRTPPGMPLIRNDHQRVQHQQRLAQGWVGGQGPVSNQTVFQANTLTLELSWPHRPVVPGVGALLRLMASQTSGYRQQILSLGLLPITRSASLAMQSHPALWPDLADGRVIYAPSSRQAGPADAQACQNAGGVCGPQADPPGPLPGAGTPVQDAPNARGEPAAPTLPGSSGNHQNAPDASQPPDGPMSDLEGSDDGGLVCDAPAT